MSGSVTIRDIAAATGYSRSTVSAALQGRSDIAETTRALIQETAEEMGYFLDPELQRLMKHLRRGRAKGDRIPLAMLVCVERDDAWERAPWNVRLWEGVQRRCRQLGFSVEVYNAVTYWHQGKDLPAILRARGIRGLILDGSFDTVKDLIDGFEPFAVVRVGTHPWKSRFHTACPDYMYNVQLALDQLCARGIKRPGLAIMSVHEERSDDMFLAGYLTWWARHAELGVAPVPLEYEAGGVEVFRTWLEREQTDAVLVSDHRVRDWIPPTLRPVHINLAEDVKGWWGIDQGRDRIGEAAVDILSAQFIRGEQGRPEHPRSIMTRGNWSGDH